MTRIDQTILFTALAFVAVTMKDEDTKKLNAADQVLELAKLIRAFCAENIPEALPLPHEEANAEDTDRIIERHVQELREKETTVLPEDRATLLRLRDRLQHRSVRRRNRPLHPTISDEELADVVLSYLDTEIEEAESPI